MHGFFFGSSEYTLKFDFTKNEYIKRKLTHFCLILLFSFIFPEKIGGKMLYISTDYVFDGRNPPYQHDSSTNPLNDYGIFKLEGEKVVLDQNEGKVDLHSPEKKVYF